MKKSLTLLFTFSFTALFAQLQLDKQLQMTGTGNNTRITGVDSVQAATDAANAKTIQKGALLYSTDIGSANNYVVNLSPPLTAYTIGMTVIFKAANNNTGASTLNVNGLGAISIKKQVTTNLTSGDILAGQMISAIYDGTNFQVNISSGGATSNMDFNFAQNITSTTLVPGFNSSSTGSNNIITLSLTYVSGTTNGIGFNIGGVPAGVTYSLTPGGCFPTCSSALYFTVSPSTIAGTYPLTISATGGATIKTVTHTLIINPFPTGKRIFYTSTLYDGNLGGISGADSKCAARAAAANHSGTYKAFISTSAVNANTRVPSAAFYRTDGLLIATSSADLLDGSIANPIRRDEFGNNTNALLPWTGSTFAGVVVSGKTCSDWTSNSNTVDGEIGYTVATDGQWADWGAMSNWQGAPKCSYLGVNLYCVEQ